MDVSKLNFPKVSNLNEVITTYSNDKATLTVLDPDDGRFERDGDVWIGDMYDCGRASTSVATTLNFGVADMMSEGIKRINFKVLLESNRANEGIVVSVTMSTQNRIVCRTGVYNGTECQYVRSAAGNMRGTEVDVSVSSGFLNSFNLVYFNNSLIHTFTNNVREGRNIRIFKAVVYNKNKLPNVSNKPARVSASLQSKVRWRMSRDFRTGTNLDRLHTERHSSYVDNAMYELYADKPLTPVVPTVPSVVTPSVNTGTVQSTGGRVLPQLGSTGEQQVPQPEIRVSTSVEDAVDGELTTQSIEEAAVPVGNLDELFKFKPTQSRLQRDQLTSFETIEVRAPGLMDPNHCRLVYREIKTLCKNVFLSNDNASELKYIIAIIQGALTYSTCNYDTSDEKGDKQQLVIVSDGSVDKNVSYKEFKTVLRKTVEEYNYSNPVRQFMRWLSTTTTDLIKTRKVRPNYAVLARHGVVSRFIPFCFDYCVMDARYNSKDEKISNALARLSALYQSNKADRYKRNDVHNFSELRI